MFPDLKKLTPHLNIKKIDDLKAGWTGNVTQVVEFTTQHVLSPEFLPLHKWGMAVHACHSIQGCGQENQGFSWSSHLWSSRPGWTTWNCGLENTNYIKPNKYYPSPRQITG